MDVLTSTGGTSILADTIFSYPVTNGEETNSKLTIEATASEMLVDAGLYVYDLQNTDSNTDIDGASKVKTYTYGTFKVVGRYYKLMSVKVVNSGGGTVNVKVETTLTISVSTPDVKVVDVNPVYTSGQPGPTGPAGPA